jgi:hypothetical protein
MSPQGYTSHEEVVCKGHWPVDPGGGWPAKSPGRPARFYVGLGWRFVDMYLHEKGKAMAVEKVSGGLSTR